MAATELGLQEIEAEMKRRGMPVPAAAAPAVIPFAKPLPVTAPVAVPGLSDIEAEMKRRGMPVPAAVMKPVSLPGAFIPQRQPGGPPVLPQQPSGYQPQPIPGTTTVGPPTAKPQVAAKPPAAAIVPKVGTIQYQQSPAEAHFEEVQARLQRQMPPGQHFLSPEGATDLRQQQKMAIAGLGQALPGLYIELKTNEKRLDQIFQQITQADAAQKRGELTQRGIDALNRQKTAFKAAMALQNQRADRLGDYNKRYQAFRTTQGDTPLFDVFKLPGEKPSPEMDAVSKSLLGFLGGVQPAEAAQRATQLLAVLDANARPRVAQAAADEIFLDGDRS